MQKHSKRNIKVFKRLEELEERLKDAEFSIELISGHDLAFMFNTHWSLYLSPSNSQSIRIKALQIAIVLAHILDDENCPNSLANLMIKEMETHPNIVITKIEKNYSQGEQN